MSADIDLPRELEDLRRIFELGDTIAAWNAIGKITARNKDLNADPYPLPMWLNDYLALAAEKIHRLSVGIAPDDNRSILDVIKSGEFGKLRGVRRLDGKKDSAQAERERDKRPARLGEALGFTGNGWNAFQRHDRVTSDDLHRKICDNPELTDDTALRNEVREKLAGLINKQENIARDGLENRLSKARGRRSQRPVTRPASQFDD